MKRWILASHPLPPLLILPPISLALTISSAILAFLIISCVFRPRSGSGRSPRRSNPDFSRSTKEEGITQVITERNREERREADRRRHEWDPSNDAERTVPTGQRRRSDGAATSTTGSPVASSQPVPVWSSDDRSDTSALSAAETTEEESESTVHAFSDTASESGHL